MELKIFLILLGTLIAGMMIGAEWISEEWRKKVHELEKKVRFYESRPNQYLYDENLLLDADERELW